MFGDKDMHALENTVKTILTYNRLLAREAIPDAGQFKE